MLSVTTIFKLYINEHVIPMNGDAYRTRIDAKLFIRHFGPDRKVTSITRQEQHDLIGQRLAEGKASATVRREFVRFYAAIRHAIKTERMEKFAFAKLPQKGPPRIVWLTDEQVATVRAQKMSERLCRFYWIAFEAAQRARAIEELTVGRVDLERREMDFRVPGVIYRNKRRGVVPISDVLYPLMVQWCKDRAPDEYVIGAGRGGVCSTTYHEAQRVMKAAGLWKKGFPPRHVARKTWASQAVQAGISSKKVGQILHDRPITVDESYAFLRPSDAHETINFKRNLQPPPEART